MSEERFDATISDEVESFVGVESHGMKRRRAQSGDAVQINDALLTQKQHLKFLKKFARNIIQDAIDSQWEPHAIGSLIVSVCRQLGILTNHRQMHKFLIRCHIGLPETLSALRDEDAGCLLGTSELVDLIFNIATGHSNFLHLIGEAFEQHLLVATDLDTVDILMGYWSRYDEGQDHRELALKICETCNTKRSCGRVLNAVSARFAPGEEAIHFVHDVVSLDFFLDMRGTLEGFLAELPAIRVGLTEILTQNSRLDQHGEIVDEDADEAGNLRGFIVNDLEEDDSDDDEEEEYAEGGDEDYLDRSAQTSFYARNDDNDDLDDDGDDDSGIWLGKADATENVAVKVGGGVIPSERKPRSIQLEDSDED